MTKASLLLSSLFLVAANAHAALSVPLTQIATLPILGNVKIVRDNPSPMLAVQPTGYVTFTYSSCRKFGFQADVVENANGTLIVKIDADSAIDCKAIAVERQYDVQISSDMSQVTGVTILNPTVPVLE